MELESYLNNDPALSRLLRPNQWLYIEGLEVSLHRFQEHNLKKNKCCPDVLKSAECKYSVEVYHVKSLSPCVKYDVLNFLHLIHVMWVKGVR